MIQLCYKHVFKWLIWFVFKGQSARNSTWDTIYEVTDPEATTISVQNLTPFMEYALRLVATNVVGPSIPSEPTKRFQTIQAPPSHAPYNVTVRAVNATQLRVRWTVSHPISSMLSLLNQVPIRYSSHIFFYFYLFIYFLAA